ncbi:uncharacterized protein EAF02_001606 [Botrytis sinoallii]|uniref:uncharacterized protein n=1 Tax=Botrytis sinoallii TaxID=1463999 RepID=UPI0018FF8E86|nr:uncharacterized protein EAF02_001606 [Botrytis sinoallii]KAF7891281.1 hypothetical protein EAF02_001606 [Botrytis sinoallii]
MASSSPATGGDIALEDDTSDEKWVSEAYRDVDDRSQSQTALGPEIMREQNILNSATETARQEERRRRNSCGGWGKWIALGFLALVLDNIIGAISLGFAIYWHNKK